MIRNKKYIILALSLLLAFAVAASAGQSKSKQSTKKKTTKAKPTTTVKQAPKAPEVQVTTVVKPEEPQEIERITVEELKEKIAKNQPVFVIDSRSQGSYEGTDTKIKGAVRIPSSEIESRLKEIPPDKEIVVYCTWPSEHTSASVAQTLLANGFKKVRALKGGWDAWVQSGGQVEPKDKPKQ